VILAPLGSSIVDTAHEYSGLETIYLSIACAVFVLVWGTIGFAIIRYRRRRADERPQGKDERSVAEGIYVVVLILVTAFLVGATFTTEDKTDRVARDPGLRVDVIGAQWNWKFVYPQQGVTVFGGSNRNPTLTVPTQTEIAFHGTSRDVIHSFWVPGTRFKRDLFPHTTSIFDLSWPHAGEWDGECAEFCGLLHANMRFKVRAVSPADFQRWAAQQRAAAGGGA
jgi:cytochrome c oxidase subunit 2